MLKFYTKILLLIIYLQYSETTSKQSLDDSDHVLVTTNLESFLSLMDQRKQLESYINLMQNRGNFSASACENFFEYALGNLGEPTLKLETSHEISALVPKLFIDNLPDNEAEFKVRDMYLSHVKMMQDSDGNKLKRINYIIEQINDLQFISKKSNQNITSKSITKLLLFDHVHNPLVRTILKLNATIDLMYSFDFSANESEIQEIFGAANFQEDIGDVIEFNKKLLTISGLSSTNEAVTLNSIDELKAFVPSASIDWKYYFNTIENEFNFSNYKIFIPIMDKFKSLIDIIDSTDKHTVLNYIKYRHIKKLFDFDDNLDIFYRYAVLNRLWANNFDKNLNRMRFLKYLGDFELAFGKLKKTVIIKTFVSKFIMDEIEKKRYVTEHYNSIITNQLRDQFNDAIDINIDNYYENLHNILKAAYKNIILYRHEMDEVRIKLLTGYFDNAIKTSYENKPYTHFYSTIGYELWRRVALGIYLEISYSSAEKFPDCLKSNTEFDILIELITQKILTQNILMDSKKSTNSELHNEMKLLETIPRGINDTNFDLLKFFYMDFVQYRYEESQIALSRNYLFDAIIRSKEFELSFKCSPFTNSSKLCKIENCDKYDKKIIGFLPLNAPKECSPTLFSQE